MTNLYKALADFQQEVPTIHENTQGYGYTYSDLNKIFKTINPLLKKHGLGFTQLLNGNSLKTVVFHVKSGESIESNVEIPQGVQLKGMNDFQVLGSAISYLRRYSISAILGLVTDKDNDASGEQQPKQPQKPVLKAGSKEFDNAFEKLNNGTITIEKIESYYTLTPDVKKLLTK